MVSKLTGAALKIREIWDIPWDDRIDDSDGETARLLLVAKNMAEDLRSAATLEATPLVIAWLLLWERNFSILTSALAMVSEKLLIAGGTPHSLELFFRQALELQLDLMVLHDPDALKFGVERSDDTDPVKGRLCAYLAICCHNESRYFDYLTKDWVLDAIDTPSKSPATPQQERLIKKLWGDGPEEQRPRRAPRSARRRWALEERNRLQNWLRHDDLAPWASKLRRPNSPRTFRSLVSGAEESVQNRMRRYGFGWAYPSYHRSSGIIHGSTVGPFLQDLGEGIEPAIVGLEEEIEKGAGHVRRMAHNNHVRIAAIRALALPK